MIYQTINVLKACYLPFDKMETVKTGVNSMMQFDDIWVGRSIMKCLLIEQEGEMRIGGDISEETIHSKLRCTRLFFDALDRMGIKRVKMEVFNDLMRIGFEGEFLELVQTDDGVLIAEYCGMLDSWADMHRECVELGKPETEIQCNESCRRKTQLISKEKFEIGTLRSIVITDRDEKCLHKDWL